MLNNETLAGKWRIVEMELWQPRYIDLVEPGYIEFIEPQYGSIHFGCIYADIHYRVNKQGRVEYSFAGQDEGKEILGSGWAKINKKQQLSGRIFIQYGDNSWFKAEKIAD